MEVEDHRYRDAFAHARAGMALLADDGTWVDANAALARLLGRPREALIGTAAHEAIFAADAAARIAGALDVRAGDGTAPQVREILEADDAADPPRHWQLTLTPLAGDAGAPALTLLQFDDVGAVQAARREQDLLAYGISHDLRAPLRGIAGFAARLAESGAANDPTAGADLDRIRAAAARAERLIDELLELSWASRQPYREEAVDISLLGEWGAAELRDAAPAREATIEVSPGLQAWGDEHWLRRLLQKLFDNAWKFSSERERVEIAMDGAVSGDVLALSIRDRGSGFDMRYAGKLFQPFQKLHGSEQGGGSGLGLAIARQVVERHGGRLWAQSRPGEGSTFFVELPATAGTRP